MSQNLITKYIWIIDTLSHYGRLSKHDLNQLWIKSKVSGGDPLPDRTFFHYRRAIEEIFHITISCDSTRRYFIEKQNSARARSVMNWMLDSMALNAAFQENDSPEGRIEIEDVPSAREFLPLVIEAIRESKKLVFTYAGFSRSRAEKNIIFRPYFLKRYKQRWYMIGLKEKDDSIRTYALDRIREMVINEESFEMPEDVRMDRMFGNIVGVTTSMADVKTVKLRVTPTQAKYFRALPLHPSQSEILHDDYSIFTYNLQLNYELVHELLALGDAVKVIAPPELRAMVVTQLKDTLAQYNQPSHE